MSCSNATKWQHIINPMATPWASGANVQSSQSGNITSTQRQRPGDNGTYAATPRSDNITSTQRQRLGIKNKHTTKRPVRTKYYKPKGDAQYEMRASKAIKKALFSSLSNNFSW
ncbi:MAG: hypothetical protein KA370_03330 [Paludibacter sp.]|nr:hypothetical protein [Paludibacter sp.]